MMMFGRRALRGGFVMRVHASMIVSRVGVHVVRAVLMLWCETDRLQVIAEARRGTIAPGEGRGRREDAEQIGEGDQPPHPDSHRSRQLQQHPSTGSLRGNVAHADCKLMANRGSAKLFLPQCTAHAQYRGTMLDRKAIHEHGPARARAKSSRTKTTFVHH
ncbi:hypothetical protein [Bradyrhizobium centrolobii]|uniref:hypothetical protein n=1 Tax=Bradyrhizobium centrolobii TaxID=1505087 RepID=UPI001FD8B80A|nr:hypothetical protein [Bradyrhizobium centrolobii]